MSTHYDVDAGQMCFVGDLMDSDSEGEWMGDEVRVEIQPAASNGRLSVKYVDEPTVVQCASEVQ